MKNHTSDCALHNGPAMVPDTCSCGVDWYMHPLIYGSEYPDRESAIQAFFDYIDKQTPREKPDYIHSDNHSDTRDNATEMAYWHLNEMIKNIPSRESVRS